MRIIYFDIDSLRPDHLGCYGYHRKTSPNLDRVAAEGVRFENCHASDSPCLPSRTALWSGRFGIHSGVVNHGGTAAEPFIEGAGRSFLSSLGQTNWMTCLRNLGFSTASISPFAERHSAWHWCAGYNLIINPGKRGDERADEVEPIVLDWLRRHGAADKWFLHVNLWDPHTPYRTPAEYGDPFAGDPLPAWLTEDVRRAHWTGCGPHSAQEPMGYRAGESERRWQKQFPRQTVQVDSMDAVRAIFDGYDTGVRYADDAIGRILNELADLGVLDETIVIISADHGENLGELNIYADHQTADRFTANVPLIVRWPGVTSPRVDRSLIYHFDFAATMIEMLGGQVPENWDGQSFAKQFAANQPAGRDFLVLSQAAWTCQRAVRWDDLLLIRTDHDAYHDYPDWMLFDLKIDPHEQDNLADSRPDLVRAGSMKLADWQAAMMRTATHPNDPFRTVMAEGGPFHARGELPAYAQRLRETGRGHLAERLIRKHPGEKA